MAVAVRARRALASRENDFESFYSAGFQVVYRAVYAFSDSAEIASEATQEAFVRAFARWRRLRRHHWATGWVMTTAMNVARKLLKERSRNGSSSEREEAHPAHDRVIERVDLVAMLSTLPPRQKQAVVLHYIGGHQLTEVAELMNLSVGGVKSHLFKARAALRLEGSYVDTRSKESDR